MAFKLAEMLLLIFLLKYTFIYGSIVKFYFVIGLSALLIVIDSLLLVCNSIEATD